MCSPLSTAADIQAAIADERPTRRAARQTRAAASGERMRTVLITGTSAGFGQLATVELATRGWRVIATMRNLDRKGPLEAALEQSGAARNVDIVQLDVTDADSIINGVAEALTITGGFLDAVVHNAGVASRRRLRGHPRRRGAPGDGDQPVRRHGADAGAAADVPQAAVGAHRDRLQRGRARRPAVQFDLRVLQVGGGGLGGITRLRGWAIRRRGAARRAGPVHHRHLAVLAAYSAPTTAPTVRGRSTCSAPSMRTSP